MYFKTFSTLRKFPKLVGNFDFPKTEKKNYNKFFFFHFFSFGIGFGIGFVATTMIILNEKNYFKRSGSNNQKAWKRSWYLNK